MKTSPVTPSDLASSVIAVPPLARSANGAVDSEQNSKIVRHIESGGVSTLLYGGNANFYHLRPSEFASTLEILAGAARSETLVIPAVGPQFGTALDQAEILTHFDFPTSMLLPTLAIKTEAGIATGFRHYVEAVGHPAVLYIKEEGYLEPETVAKLVNEGLVSWIKYAIVREIPKVDPYLQRLVELVDPEIIVSGIGEQPAITHLMQFGVGGFTSGCVCVAPALSQQMLIHLKEGEILLAEDIRLLFQPLENLRNEINPIRVLHEALALAGIAETGPHLPYLTPLSDSEQDSVNKAAQELLALSRTTH